jgi:hypothetical protein
MAEPAAASTKPILDDQDEWLLMM